MPQHPHCLRSLLLRCLPAVVVIAFTPLSRAQLTWDALSKEHEARRGATNAIVSFHFTNRTSAEIAILAVNTSCHCTVPKIPRLPWTIKPGVSEGFDVEVDLAVKWGVLHKTISVETSAGTNLLSLTVTMPEPTPREKNQIEAFVNRQAVFARADCASCHLQPGIGKKGAELYKAVCGICHEAEHRAEMVPDLAALKVETGPMYWQQSVRMGKPGTLMPAFEKRFGGPLTEDQILSLVAYLAEHFHGKPGPPESKK